MSFARLDLGHGIGLRSKHYGRFLEERPAVDWVEAISENHLSPGGRTGRSTSRKWSWTRSRHARFGKPFGGASFEDVCSAFGDPAAAFEALQSWIAEGWIAK